MLIDWFTVTAQALNFLILIWLLNRFLYKPILHAIEARENKIKAELEAAASKMEEAEKEQREFQHKNEELEKKRESLLDEATGEARERRQQLLEEARKEASGLRARLEQSLKEERETLNREIIERTQQEVFAIARKVLSDLASASLEEHMARMFLQRLKEMEKEPKDQLAKALRAAPGEVAIKSAYPLPAQQQEAIEAAAVAIAGQDLHCLFETAPKKISGIELSAGGYKMAWSVADYLGSMEKKLAELLDKKPEPASETTEKTTANESTAR